MGKVVLVGGEKGGTGKSTVATNLAVYLVHEGFDVILLDCDPQPSSSRWIARRNAGEYREVHSAQKLKDVYKTAIDLSNRYEFVIIDAGGRDSMELRTAMVAADYLYVPIRASQYDLETLTTVNTLVAQARTMNPGLVARTLLCMAPTNERIREVEDARELMQEFPDLPLSGCVIRDRKAYRDAALLGCGVMELKNQAAKAEIQLLGQEILA